MQRARGWANAAIVIALVASPVTVCVGLFQKAALGFARESGECAGDDCANRHDHQVAAANRLVYGGFIGGAALVIGGLVGRRATRRSRRPEHEGEGAAELPRARVNRIS